MYRQRGSRGPQLALLLLVGQMARVGFNNIPPVTLASIAAQVVIHLRLLKVNWPTLNEVCISPINVWYKEEWSRLFFGTFFHANDWHLYYNMVSMLWKGIKLEPVVGSGYLLYMIMTFTVLTNVLYVGMGLAAEAFLGDPSYLSQCAVGFSGVLFALKVISTHASPPGVQYMMGFIPVPTKYACWAELLLIHILVPRASFMGHLSGILVGLWYVKGGLKPIMDSLLVPAPSRRNYAAPSFGSFFRPSRHRDWATPAPRNDYEDYATHSSQNNRPSDTDTNRYTGGMNEEEQMQQAMRNSLRQDDVGTGMRPEPTAPPMDYASGDSAPPRDHSSIHSPASGTTRLYPDISGLQQEDRASQSTPSRGLSASEIRSRRLKRFDSRS